MLNSILPIFGAIGLILRLYVSSVKLKSGGDHRFQNGHLSRFLSYVLCIALILNFENNVFTLIVAVAFPTMVIAFFGTDVPFFIDMYRNPIKEDKEKNGWLIFERFTLHIPLVTAGIWIWVINPLKLFSPLINTGSLVAGIILSWVFYLIFDPRWVKKSDGNKIGYLLLFGAIIETIFLFLYIFPYHEVPNPPSLLSVEFNYPIIGSLLLLFRMWLCEVKLKRELGKRSLFLNRITNYYFFIAMILCFENQIFNLIIFFSVPLQIFVFLTYDIDFYVEFSKKITTNNKNNKDINDLHPIKLKKNLGWLFIERITVHNPLIICGFIMYFSDLNIFFPEIDVISITVAFIISYGSFFFMDQRSKNFYKFDRKGFWIFLINSISFIGSSFYLTLI
ncbi:MAG: hypothetical protein GY870_01485 [archaeon]|nr:hypothetical protein [archaeon]